MNGESVAVGLPGTRGNGIPSQHHKERRRRKRACSVSIIALGRPVMLTRWVFSGIHASTGVSHQVECTQLCAAWAQETTAENRVIAPKVDRPGSLELGVWPAVGHGAVGSANSIPVMRRGVRVRCQSPTW